eukprot:Nitzschia sp. Nitz4//scaffold18_size181773//13700//14698//NITZ4_001892-RA/size181773-processed-gene-0.1-mRNA-1//1//CDS//3329539942//26//frame0
MQLKQGYSKLGNRKVTTFLGWTTLLVLASFIGSIFFFVFFPALEGCSNKSSQSIPTSPLGSTISNIASAQSFGFLDDVPNDTWKRLQTYHNDFFPNHSPNIQRYSGDSGNSHIWYNDNFHSEFDCPSKQRIPLNLKGDGAKWVCNPHRLETKRDCLVYSVGSNGETSFEQGIRDVIGDHCEIHTFDMMFRNDLRGDFAKNLKGIATFHKWGLGTAIQAQRNPQMFKTLAQTMDALGHTNRTIDIFKIDCEGCEWSTVQDWLQQDIRQILVETHDAPWPKARDFFFQLHDAGYVIYSKEPNLYTSGHCVEYGFLKLSLDFFENHFYMNRKYDG